LGHDQTLRIVPLLRHLQPPNHMGCLRIDRFSPYFERPHQYGITALRPLPVYRDVLPKDADPSTVAYHFTGTYRSGSLEHPEVMTALANEVRAWQDRWAATEGQPPVLEIVANGDGAFELRDTRGLPGTQACRVIGREEAVALTGAKPIARAQGFYDSAQERKLGLALDGMFVPLATADPELLAALESAEAPRPNERAPVGPALL
jgi:hypothetical protein